MVASSRVEVDASGWLAVVGSFMAGVSVSVSSSGRTPWTVTRGEGGRVVRLEPPGLVGRAAAIGGIYINYFPEEPPIVMKPGFRFLQWVSRGGQAQ